MFNLREMFLIWLKTLKVIYHSIKKSGLNNHCVKEVKTYEINITRIKSTDVFFFALDLSKKTKKKTTPKL